MDFEKLYERIKPRLKKMARWHNGHGQFIDGDDLYQEMCAHLWNAYKDGVPEGINDAYIVKGCEFHILNYLRKHREKANIISMEQPINEEGDRLEDIIRDKGEPLEYSVEKKIAIEEIKNNGFSEKEKTVFSLLLEGRTIREVGMEVGISHVMVLKYKKNMINHMREVTKKGSDLL
ncbi:MAG: sigma-70 family RNA polymerase sigma factor [Candidatus Omnitrophota bacterium]|nr:sigma-70 family RNA polymerase sigma factor [Candidatus Omnitrophota bacterium]